MSYIFKQLDMETWMWVLAGWLAFDAVVFVWAWWDDFYYTHNVKKVFGRLKEAFTEE